MQIRDIACVRSKIQAIEMYAGGQVHGEPDQAEYQIQSSLRAFEDTISRSEVIDRGNGLPLVN
jgi:hypothetical protein